MKIHELLSTEDNWCSHAFACDVVGNSVNWHAPSAVRFDFLGAYLKCYSHESFHGHIFHKIYKTPEFPDYKSLPFVGREWGWYKVYTFCLKYNL